MATRESRRAEASASDLAPGVEPLTEAERRWIRALERVLRRMPDRLLLLESGSLSVVDRAAAARVDLEDGRARRSGVWLANVRHSEGKTTGVSA